MLNTQRRASAVCAVVRMRVLSRSDEKKTAFLLPDTVRSRLFTCPNAKQMVERYPYRIIKAKWRNTGKRNSFQATIHISGSDRSGIVTDISRIISKEVGIQMRSIAINSENKAFDGTLRVLVNDLEHLDFLIQKLKNIKGVLSVTRSDA